MTCRQDIAAYHVDDFLRQRQQAQQIRHRRAGLRQPLCHGLLGVAALLHQALNAHGGFDGVEVLALDVLDQCDLHLGHHIHLADDAGHSVQTGLPGRAPAAFAGNDAISATLHRRHQDGLQNALLLNGLGQLGNGLIRENMAGLIRIGVDITDGDLLTRTGGSSVQFGQQGIKSTGKSTSFLRHS